MQHPFIWHDLLTTDVAAAKAFYSAVVGWRYTHQPPAYSVIEVDGMGIGGLMQTPPEVKGMPPFWSGYIYTPDVDAACTKAEKLGGKVHRAPWDIPDMLRMAVLLDPSGAAFNIMQPYSTEARKAPGAQALGAVGWNELHSGDVDQAFAFYAAMFGWTAGDVIDMGPEAGLYKLFQINGQDAGGMMRKMPTMPMPVWAYYFNVDGIDAAALRIAKAGGKVMMGPQQVPGNQWVLAATDPQGGWFNLLSGSK